MDYTENLKNAVHIAQSIAKEYQNNKFTPGHLLKALMNKDVGLMDYLVSKQKDILYIEEWADVRIDATPKSPKLDSIIRGDDAIETVMEEAENIRLKLGRVEIDPVSVLAALATPGVGFSYDQLKTLPLNGNEIVNDWIDKNEFQSVVGGSASSFAMAGTGTSVNGDGKANALYKYCIDKIALARDGKMDNIIGRDRETRMMAEILGRRSKPNVIITGEPGVGKTALVDGFTLNIINGKVPEQFKSARIFELDFGSLVAGASYKGEVEDRLKNLIKEIKQFDKAILFIDEIHNLVDKNGGAGGAAQLLKPELARGELTIIGATTNEEYRKHIERDEAFSRRFELLRVDEPTSVTAERMVKMILPYYEAHHKLKMAPDVPMEAVRLSKRYDKDRRLPDSAIDLVDRTMAAVKIMGETRLEDINAFSASLEAIKNMEPAPSEKELLKELKWFYSQLVDKISPITLALVENQRDEQKIDNAAEMYDYTKCIIGELAKAVGQRKETVDKTDLAAVVSLRTGIPLGKLQSGEQERLLHIEDWLRKRVIGQDHALHAVSEAILESRSGLGKAGQPIGSFFFLGPTGTGKTELAKTLAEFMFLDESAMIRFDMSEFKEEHSVATLNGAPPGYVGYEEGGMLVNKIREQPYAVVLFDEIEKAHPKVYDLFLQILDEGKLHDRLGKEGDFSNAVILFTSNIGSDFIVEKFGKGEIPTSNELVEVMARNFRPEFLGRLSEVVPFGPITEANVVGIFKRHLKPLLASLELQGIKLEITDAAIENLAKTGFSPRLGARPVIGVIRNQLRRPLSKKIVAGELERGSTVNIDLNEAKELIWKFS